MIGGITKGKIIGMLLLLLAASTTAQQPTGNLSGYLPANGEISDWEINDEPKTYHGNELFLMIDGGADIYHEYGFSQVVRAEYFDGGGKSIGLEIYEMKSPASAYGIYTFKTSDGGKKLSIGQEALLQDYYLNFWKGYLLVTLIGQDSDEKTVQGIVKLAKAVDARIAITGERPKLADLLLGEPLAFSHPKYVRGPLGVMDSYIFDMGNIFRVREGMIGTIGDCRIFVFRYAEEDESALALKYATSILDGSSDFTSLNLQGNRVIMVGHEKELVEINKIERYITVVVGQNQDKVRSTSYHLIAKLKNG